MLLNLSNHPTPTWPEAQRRAALERFGKLDDLPFPQISPHAGLEQIEALAEAYLAKVLYRQAGAGSRFAVHLMGEMTFTYTLANLLRSRGIPCFASTTERTVTEEKDGRKVSHFHFIRFRPYYPTAVSPNT